MRAALRALHSPDVADLRQYLPADPGCFSILVQAIVGPEGQLSGESFDFMLCTPSWLHSEVERNGPQVGAWHVVVNAFDYDSLFAMIGDRCHRCEGASWQEVAIQVGRLGHWEFNQYRERM